MKKIFWVFPDRGSVAQNAVERETFWAEYERAAEQVGLSMRVVTAEDIDMIYTQGGSPTAFVKGEQVYPSETMFVTELYTFPHQTQDCLTQITTYHALKGLDFYLPIPPELSATMNDKFATYLFFQDAELNILPSIRLTTGRDVEERELAPLLQELDFPMVVKPSSWGSGQGVNVAASKSDLRSILGLASGSDTTMILQPYVGSGVLIDYRIYFIGNEPHTVLSRTAQDAEIVANLSRGGNAEVVKMPAGLASAASEVSRFLELPYFCADFLFDGETYWLSEVELDGAIAYIEREHLERVLMDRFKAYSSAHEMWLHQKEKLVANYEEG